MTFLYILLAIVVLLFMVLVHELGHYIAGKILILQIKQEKNFLFVFSRLVATALFMVKKKMEREMNNHLTIKSLGKE